MPPAHKLPPTPPSPSLLLHPDHDIDPTAPPRTPAALHTFLRDHFDLEIPTTPLLPTSTAPFDYLVHTFFEARRISPASTPQPPQPFPLDPTRPSPPPIDAVLWANRGGGKTFLGAVATMLDLVFKPGIQVRILGGSLEQSRRMHAHLRALFDRPALAPLVDGRMTDKRLRLKNGSCAEVLAQSETAVRGTRVQKLRCDEVELFDRDIWNAAQLATRSLRLRGPWGNWVRGSVEALSTMHQPFGLMWEIVAEAGGMPGAAALHSPAADPAGRGPRRPTRRLFRWGVVDVLAHCGRDHSCASCSLWDECAGRAKGLPPAAPGSPPHTITLSIAPRPTRAPGHIPIADALAMKARVDVQTWKSEMLCLHPRRSHLVYPEFDPVIHVFDAPIDPPGDNPNAPAPPDLPGTLLCGMDFGFRAPTVILWALLAEDNTLRIIDERSVAESLLQTHIDAIVGPSGAPGARGWPRPEWIGADPAGGARNSQSGASDIQLMRAAGLSVRPPSLQTAEGITLVRARLAPADASTPRLLIHRRCTTLIESLSRYHYDENRPESVDPVKDGPDHAADALRYLITTLDKPRKCRSGTYLP